MRLLFWRKKKIVTDDKPKFVPKEWAIPSEHIEEVLTLYDSMMRKPTRKLRRYLFWKKIMEVLPETDGYDKHVVATAGLQCIKLVQSEPGKLC